MKGQKVEEVKAYIESGILELYVLGDVTLQERLQVEEWIAKYPAVKAEVTEIERSMEAYALANAVHPSENQRAKVLNSLLTNFGDDSTFNKNETTERSSTVITAPIVRNNVVAMPTARANNFYKYAFAASLALFIASTIALYNTYNRLQETSTQLVAITAQNQRFSKTVSLMDGQLGVFRDTSYRLLRLKGTAKLPSGGMTVAFNPAEKKVMIDMASVKMPDNDQNHQYQLWALVGNKPIDLGVFDKTEGDTTDMKQMKPIASADAFAVTLEPRGGSVNPTADQMMVVGKL